MTISPDRRWLIVMVKEPRPGRVKTRLGREIGLTASAWWYRHQVACALRHLRDPRWQIVLAVSPDKEGLLSRVWPADLVRWPQGRGDLGDRMGRVFHEFPAGAVLVIGSDIPGVTRGVIARSFESLRGYDAVVGPAPDGGYWLIGFRRQRPVPKRLFQDVRWSSKHALADTLATMTGLRIARVDELNDVDTAADLT